MKREGFIENKQERIKILVSVGITGIDKPWAKMSMAAKARYAMYIDPKRAKDVAVARISRKSERASFIASFPWVAKQYDINKFDDWILSVYIIQKVPSLLKKVDKNRISKLRWGEILIEQPQLARYCDFASLSEDWCALLRGCPSLWRECPFDSFTREEQIECASVSMPILKKLGLNSLTEKEWYVLQKQSHFSGSEVGKWVAHELKRLTKLLILPR